MRVKETKDGEIKELCFIAEGTDFTKLRVGGRRSRRGP